MKRPSFNMDLVSVSRPFLEQLRDATGETVHLAILSDRDVVEVCTGTGKAMLAHSVAPHQTYRANTPRRRARIAT